MDTRLTDALRGFRARYPGQDASWKRLEGWLLDHAPQEKRAVKAIVAVPKLDLHLELERIRSQGGANPKIDAFAFRRLTDVLTNQEGLSPDLAEQAVLAWLETIGIATPDATALRGPLDTGALGAKLDVGRCLHLAMLQAGLPLVSSVRIEGLSNRAYSDLLVSVWLSGSEVASALKSTTWTSTVDRVRGRQVVIASGVDAQVTAKPLSEIRAPIAGRWWVEVKTRDEILLRSFHEVEVVPARTWPRGRIPVVALAAFVLREDGVVAEIVSEASGRVDDADPRPGAMKALDALRSVVQEMGIEAENDRDPAIVTGPRALLAGGKGTTTDLQLLLAACLEHGGMPPLLIWTTSGPAIGVWTTVDRPTLTETDDAELIARLEDSGALAIVPAGSHVIRVRESSSSFAALDLASARRAGVLPLDTLSLDDGRASAGGGDLRQRLLDRAALAANRTGMLLPGAWGARLGRRQELTNDTTPPRLQHWKRRLLDLTLNNPLLNLRQRVTSLPLLVADIAALEDSLAGGQTFRLEARPAPGSPGQPKPDVTKTMMDGAAAAGGILVDLTDRRVVTQAKNAHRAFRAALDEGGVHTLFLTLGSLTWFDAVKPTEQRTAPLLLVPILIRRSRMGHYEIKRGDGETELNAALIEFLRREHGIEVPGVDPLPQDHSGIDVPAVLAAVQKAIASSTRTASWTVESSTQIAILAFSGFRMWRDLDHQAADLLRHPLVRRLTTGECEADAVAFPERSTLDQRWKARDVLCPLEADGSQLAAILAAAEGKSFVLEGPPGTGKSQTIANLIAQCLASGKSVLFVSQKRAALEVVESRLGAIGLGPFLLELHSRKASKPEFIKQLRVAAEYRPRKPPREWNDAADELGTARDELNAVVHALHDSRDPGLSVFSAIIDAEHTSGRPRLNVDFDPARAFDKTWMSDSKSALADLVPSFTRLTAGWQDLDAVRATDWPKARREELERGLADLREAAGALESACKDLAQWMPDLGAASADDLELADVVLGQIESSPKPKRDLLTGGDANDTEVEEWLESVDSARKKSEKLDALYRPSLLEQDLERRVTAIRQWQGVFLLGWFVLLTVRWFFRPFVKAAVPSNNALLTDAEAAIELRGRRTEVLEAQASIASSLGKVAKDAWGLPSIDREAVKRLIAFAKGLRNRAKKFPNAIVLAADGAPDDASEAIARFRKAYARWTKELRAVTSALDLAGGFSKPTDKDHLSVVKARVETIGARIPLLRDWGAYRRNRDACNTLGLGKVVKALERSERSERSEDQGERGELADPETLVEAFSNAWIGWWIDHRVANDKHLASFDGLKQRRREETFADLDRGLRELARYEILARVAARQPRLDAGAPPTSQAGILLRQFGKKAGFASPRQLFSECAGLIRQLKPCVLMSPQSVAQYLDPSQPPFDVVVFDEASQVPTHEAIGAIARGRHVIVVGDSKQLPPTAFFLGAGQGKEDGDGDGDDVALELDSILEECAASGLPSLGLAWHYRSRHPSLISYSNARYYGSRLQVLPAARAHSAGPRKQGVFVRRVDGAVYDRGGTATNAAEARMLVAEVIRRLTDPEEHGRSLGVVTFSRAQQALVEDLLEEARERNPAIEPFFDPERPEPVIVKNLENIQGDERDVILFSIGYGPDAKGKMTANMGPLGQLGGERRLNVAITRAREELVVFLSFEPASLDLSATSAQGLHDLKAFLDSAASPTHAVLGEQVDVDPREEAFKHALTERLETGGHVVDVDVGVGRSRVDIGVRDPNDPEAYCLGIELDGPAYAATDTARDRDRLRWDVLKGLGWRMHRARALDWYEDREGVVKAALEAITQAVKLADHDRALAAAAPKGVSAPAAAPEASPTSESDETLDAGAELLEAAGPDAETVPPAPVAEASPVSDRSAKRLYQLSQPTPRTGDFNWHHRDVPTTVAEIVDAEGPICERLLGRRIADAWGLKRAPTGLGGIASSVLSRIADNQRPILRDGFFWPPSIDLHAWRLYRVPDPNVPETRRDVDDIPVEELANAAEDLLTRYGNMPREDLARAIAKRFGYRGLTRGVATRVEQGIVMRESRTADPAAILPATSATMAADLSQT